MPVEPVVADGWGSAGADTDPWARADMRVLAQAAVCVVAELALHPGAAVPLAPVGERHGLSRRELARIAAVLEQAAILRPVRGAPGGWTLCASPRRLSLQDVMRLFPSGPEAGPAGPPSAVGREVKARLAQARRLAEAALESVTIEALVTRIGREDCPAPAASDLPRP